MSQKISNKPLAAFMALAITVTTAQAQSQMHDAGRADCSNRGGTYDWKSNYCEMPSDDRASTADSGCGIACMAGGLIVLGILGAMLSEE